MVRVFANGPGVIPKIQKMVLDAALLNTQHYKVQIKGKVEQSRQRSCTLPYTIKKGPFGLPTLLTYLHMNTWYDKPSHLRV